MRDLIKNILRESKDDDDKIFISNFEKEKVRVQKTLPLIIKYLTNVLNEYNIYDISTGEKGVVYGSTVYYNDVTGERELFNSKIPVITLRFIDLTHTQKREVRHKVYNYIEDMFGFNLMKYGNTLNIKFINLEEEEF
jgi:hypothetical protein